MDTQMQTEQCGTQYSWNVLHVIIAFLAGIIVGFLVAPIKAGMTIGCENGNGNTITNNDCAVDG